MRPIELLAVVFGVIYIVLASRNKVSCWLFGIISSALWAYAAYTYYQFYADAALMVFYVAAGVWGWVNWSRAGDQQKPISVYPLSVHILLILIGGLVALLAGHYLNTYTNALATYWDATGTVFSLIATYLLGKRKLENWIYWLPLNVLYFALYYQRDGYYFTALQAVYVVMSVVGYYQWRTEYRHTKALNDSTPVPLQQHLINEL